MSTDEWALVGQILVLIGAVLGAGGGLKYLVEPLVRRRRLRKVMATNLWLSCHELRKHIESLREAFGKEGKRSETTRNALKKIPRFDFGDQADWFVKDGYYTMIIAYKIAVFSAWMGIYQSTVLKALLFGRSNRFASQLFQKFDNFKVAASTNTLLWDDYVDAIGEPLVVSSKPIGFSVFCKRYAEDKQFMLFLEQLHMFIHFLGRTEGELVAEHQTALVNMASSLKNIEDFLSARRENLLRSYAPKSRDKATPALLSGITDR